MRKIISFDRQKCLAENSNTRVTHTQKDSETITINQLEQETSTYGLPFYFVT